MGLNSECLTKELQKLSVSLENSQAVFGLMMSNSRLCKQIHGMMRASLRSGTGMDEADARRSFASDLGYHLKQERRDLVSEPLGPPKKKYRPVKDNRSKSQQGMVSKQLLREADKFVSEAKYLLLQDNNGIPSSKDIHLVGRRSQDKKTLRDQLRIEKAKADGLKRGVLTVDTIKVEAKREVLSNDKVMRIKIAKMSTKKFWEKN